jgi:protein disulfide-isomerase
MDKASGAVTVDKAKIKEDTAEATTEVKELGQKTLEETHKVISKIEGHPNGDSTSLALNKKTIKQAQGTQADVTALSDSEWLTNYTQAAEKAKKEHKVILLDFTGSDWCGWCMKLKTEVFDKKEFKDWAASKAVLVEVDFPRQNELPADQKMQNEDLGKKFEIKGFPTIVMLDPMEKKIGELGYQKGGPDAWTKSCDEIIDKAVAR